MYHLIWCDWVILSLFPVVGLGIYMVRKWGWYLLVGFSFVLIFYNINVYLYLNPNYQLSTVILFIVFVIVTTGIFFSRHIFELYFNPRLRWWEVAPRYKLDINTNSKMVIKKKTKSCRILDISSTGCFVKYAGHMCIGDSIRLIIQSSKFKLNCSGKVARKSIKQNRTGYGIYFESMSRDTKHQIRNMTRTLKALGLNDREGSIKETKIPEGYIKEYNYPLNRLGLRLKPLLRFIA